MIMIISIILLMIMHIIVTLAVQLMLPVQNGVGA